jgi:hypothetical protein
VSRPAVWRWQQRFAEAGVEGLLRDKTRPHHKNRLLPSTIAKVLSEASGQRLRSSSPGTIRLLRHILPLAMRNLRTWSNSTPALNTFGLTARLIFMINYSETRHSSIHNS